MPLSAIRGGAEAAQPIRTVKGTPYWSGGLRSRRCIQSGRRPHRSRAGAPPPLQAQGVLRERRQRGSFTDRFAVRRIRSGISGEDANATGFAQRVARETAGGAYRGTPVSGGLAVRQYRAPRE